MVRVSCGRRLPSRADIAPPLDAGPVGPIDLHGRAINCAEAAGHTEPDRHRLNILGGAGYAAAMSVETFFLVRRNEPRPDLRDLDRVALTAAVTTDDGDVMSAGAQGTIVGVWREGAAYEVEFAHPVGALATVEAGSLKLVDRAAP